MMGGGNGQQQQVVAVPPGFRFHPTDEELLYYYLRKKISYESIDLDVIREVDLNKLEPWDLKERCRIGSGPQNEWYFFSHKDKKYPTGTRTNRATTAGFWKATGRDKAIHQQQEQQHVTSSSRRRRIGMRKTLVFYTGRAPHGQKTDWIMHEYRLLDHDPNPEAIQEEGWVVCRVFKKKNPNRISSSTLFPNSQPGEDEADQQDHHQLAAAHNGDSNNHHNCTPKQSFVLQLQAQAAAPPPPYVNYSNNSPHHPNYTCTHFGGTTNYNHNNSMIMHLPQLLTSPDHHDHPTSAEGPIGGHLVMMNNHDNLQDPSSTSNNSCSTGCAGGVQLNIHDPHSSHSHFTNGVAAADWSFLDKLLASHHHGGGLGHVQGLGRLDHQSKFNQLQQIPLVLGRDDDHHAPPPPNLSQIFPFQYLGHQN